MTALIVAFGTLISGLGIGYASMKFTVDAAPVGSVMLLVSCILLIISIFLFGMATCHIVH